MTVEAAATAAFLLVIAAAGAALLAWSTLAQPRLGLYAIFALAPTQFIFVPVSDFFISPADVLVLCATAGFALRLAAGGMAARRALQLHVFVGMMIVGYLAGFLVLEHFSRTLVRIPLAVIPSLVACELLRERRHLARALAALVVAGVVDAAYGGWYLAAGARLHPTRFSGMMGVNFTAMVVLTAAAIAFALLARTPVRVRLALPAGLTLVGLATLSKMGLLALGVAWSAAIAPVSTRGNRRLAAGAAILFAAVALSQAAVRERVFARVAQPELQMDGVERTSTEVRMLILRRVWSGLAEHPFAGVGYFGFEAYSRRDPEILSSTGGAGYATHNTYLEILVEGGLLAFVPFLLHFLLLARRLPTAWIAVTRRRDVLAAAALAGLIVILISAAVANVLLHYLFWSVCGVALATMERVRGEAG